jgi:hypothetical protein
VRSKNYVQFSNTLIVNGSCLQPTVKSLMRDASHRLRNSVPVYPNRKTVFQTTVQYVGYSSNTNCNVGYHTVMSSRAISYVSVWRFRECRRIHRTNQQYGYSVAYRPVAKLWLCKHRPFPGSGSVNTFQGQRIRTEQDYCWKWGVLYVVRSEI